MTRPTTVSAIVPARNEQDTITASVESLARQPEIAEIIVVNDHSADQTATVLSQLALHIPHLRCIEANTLPEGWVGKNFALCTGAARATGDWLLFTDADVVHLANSTGRALAAAASTDAALVSYSPQQEMKTWWERALIPFIFCRLAQNFSYNAVNDPKSDVAAANGQYLLIRRDAFEAVGGHHSVAWEVLEDVALARLVKRAGYRVYFAPGPKIAKVRMYNSFSAMWQGWTKNLYPLMIGPGKRLWREIASVGPWIPLLFLMTSLMPFRVLRAERNVLAIAGLILLAGRHVVYAGMLRRNHFPLSCILYYGLGVALYAAALLTSARCYAQGTITWKGREVRVTSPRD